MLKKGNESFFKITQKKIIYLFYNKQSIKFLLNNFTLKKYFEIKKICFPIFFKRILMNIIISQNHFFKKS